MSSNEWRVAALIVHIDGWRLWNLAQKDLHKIATYATLLCLCPKL